MARNINPETRALANRFIEKFGHVEIDVDQLDMFLRDEGILPDLDFDRDQIKAEGGTLNIEQQQAWDGLVAARQNGRNLLMRGGKQLANGHAFSLKTIKSGEIYQIRPLADAAKDYAVREMGEKVRTFAKGRLAEFKAISKQLDWILENSVLEDLTPQVLEVHQMYKTLDTHARLMQKKIDALTVQYSNAVNAATEQAKLLIEAAGGNGIPQLEDQSEK